MCDLPPVISKFGSLIVCRPKGTLISIKSPSPSTIEQKMKRKAPPLAKVTENFIGAYDHSSL